MGRSKQIMARGGCRNRGRGASVGLLNFLRRLPLPGSFGVQYRSLPSEVMLCLVTNICHLKGLQVKVLLSVIH